MFGLIVPEISNPFFYLSQYILPPLWTIEMSQAQRASMAFHALLSDVQRGTPDLQGTEYLLKARFVLRESTV
jgi:DNA-binding LacI/PurR family transcriptional regulator